MILMLLDTFFNRAVFLIAVNEFVNLDVILIYLIIDLIDMQITSLNVIF